MFCATRGQSSLRYFAIFSVLTLTLSLSFASGFGRTDELDHFSIRVGKTVKITAYDNYCWYPTVHRFPTGEILTTMRMSPDDTNPEGEFSAYCLSKDGGQARGRRNAAMGAGANARCRLQWGCRSKMEFGCLDLKVASWNHTPPAQKRVRHVTLTQFSRVGLDVHQVKETAIFTCLSLHNSSPWRSMRRRQRMRHTLPVFLRLYPLEQSFPARVENGCARCTTRPNGIDVTDDWC